MYDDQILHKAHALGLNPKKTAKGYSIRCPKHYDRNNSALAFSDDGWAVCFAGCGRWDFLRTDGGVVRVEPDPEPVYGEFFDYWLELEPLEEGIKGLPASHLNSLGWRQFPDQNPYGVRGGIFIPYFRTDRHSIPFFQVRHLAGDRRFSFAPGITPICYGLEALGESEDYVIWTEGSSDAAVLRFLGVPAIALPSASSGRILRAMERWADEQGKTVVVCGDNDDAGNALISSLSGAYIDLRAPAPYKDYGEMFEALGAAAVRKWLRPILPSTAPTQKDIDKVMEIMNA